MANFFENKDVPRTTTEKDTPSEASQAGSQFKVQMLGQLLGALGQHSPSFAEYAGGAQYPNRYAGMGDVSGLLSAMSQPGAFTSTKDITQTGVNWAPSDFSSLMGLGVGGLSLLNALAPGGALSGAGGVLGDILAPLGGMLHITGPKGDQLNPNDVPSRSANAGGTVSVGGQPWGGGGGIDPGLAALLGSAGSTGTVPGDGGYGVLLNSAPPDWLNLFG